MDKFCAISSSESNKSTIVSSEVLSFSLDSKLKLSSVFAAFCSWLTDEASTSDVSTEEATTELSKLASPSETCRSPSTALPFICDGRITIL